MTLDRSPLLPLVLLGFSALAANACGGSKSGDDDSSTSGKGAVLSGGTTGSGATGQGGGGATTETGGTGGSNGGNGGTTTTSGGTAGSLAGGAGSSGTSGKGGGAGGTSSGTSGSGGGSGTSSTSSALGLGCTKDGDCGTGLTCLATADTQTLGGVSLPGGLCTAACKTDADCATFENGAYCVPLDLAGKAGYCIESCALGTENSPKCQERSNFACTAIGDTPTTKSCASDADCAAEQICDPQAMVCGDVVTGCAPACRGDFDCSSGQYCDFSSGACFPGTSTGLALGAACDPNATTDPCDGICAAVDAAGTIGACTGICEANTDFTGCGWDGKSTANAACLFAPFFVDPTDVGLNDVGFCGALCDCNDDCTVQTERCVDDTNGAVMKIWGRAGYCRALFATETDADSIACK